MLLYLKIIGMILLMVKFLSMKKRLIWMNYFQGKIKF